MIFMTLSVGVVDGSFVASAPASPLLSQHSVPATSREAPSC
jgi:hypothetical protein